MDIAHPRRPSGSGRASSLCLLAAIAVTVPLERLPAQDVVISELQASNGGVLLDEDDDSSDWIELHSVVPFTVDLDGWYLTDDPGLLTKWRFPSVSLGGGGYLVVFASDKNRAIAGEELHTNFRLSADGEFLALVEPDGITIASAYTPAFPRQFSDVSFGTAQANELTSLIEPGSIARVTVPSSGADGLDWTTPGFDDSSWTGGRAAVGFDTESGGDGGAEPVNIAPEGSASQSSTLSSFVASAALDGDFGNFTHTQAGDSPAWWELDLGAVRSIDRIALYNRTSCCASRLRDITIEVLDGGRSTTYMSALLNPENALGGGTVSSGPATLGVDLVAALGAPVAGRYVRVTRTPDFDLSGSDGDGNADEAEVLQLAEVEVYERPVISYDSLIETDLEAQMLGVNASAYVRVPFVISNVPTIDLLRLTMRYDDGFIAYLNGQEVARRNAPDLPVALAWTAAATAERADESALVEEELVITEHRALIGLGTNVLAIHALNLAAGDDDFLASPRLEAFTIDEDADVYFRVPTPGAVNDTPGILGFVADTRFSHDRGFYDEPFLLDISTETPGAEVRYTLDGTVPTASSGLALDGSLLVDRTTVVRAAAFKPGLEPSNVDTQSYFFLDDVTEQDPAATLAAGFPSSWNGTSPDYGMDPDVVDQDGGDRYGGKYAATIRDDLLAIPTISIVLDIDDMFGARGIYSNPNNRGEAWERPCSVEFVYPDGSKDHQVDCGIRIQGGAFRSFGLTKKKSFRLLFKAIYGSTKLRFPLFGPRASGRLDTITLRANNNDGWQWSAAGSRPLYIRDSFGRETVLAMDGVASHEMFAHLYINGFYWGLYNPVERPDHSFSATYFGGEKEDWDAISNGSASNGNLSAWNDLLALARGGLASNADYLRIQGRNPNGTENPAYPVYVDAVNVADYMIANLWVGNTDWPNKNYWIARARVASTGFKFYMWDSEWSMGINSDLNTNRVGVDSGVAEPYARLRENAEFRLLFADRIHRHFFNGGALHVDPADRAWDPSQPERNRPAARFARLADIVDRAVVAESARWGDQHNAVPYTRDEHWAPERNGILANYLPDRTSVVLQQFRAAGLYPDVEAPTFSLHGGRVPDGFALVATARSGTVYYTTDGTDPRDFGGAVSPTATAGGTSSTTTVLAEGDAARVLVPTDGTLGLSWIEPGFSDSGWRAGFGGVGYERNTGYEELIGTDVEAETYQINASFYMRQEFTIGDLVGVAFATLRVKFDDGFVAYLNGSEVASVNPPVSPSWNSNASASHPDDQAIVFQDFRVDTEALVVGTNVLAIHGLNSSPSSSDFLVSPALTISRLEGGGIPITEPVLVRSRAREGTTWSALNEAFFYFDIPLRVTEIMFHPRDPENDAVFADDDFEFIELQNVGESVVNLVGVRLLGGIEFDFSEAAAILGPGEVVVLVNNASAFVERYPFIGADVLGEFRGNLSNTGDAVILEGPDGEPILDFDFSDTWLTETDGDGYSLTIADPLAAPESWGAASSWRASAEIDGSPGTIDGSEPPTGGLQIPGDVNQDARLDISDAVNLLLRLFLDGGRALPCDGASLNDGGNLPLADVNGDTGVDLTDAVSILNYLFLDGAPPVLGARCRRIEGCPSMCP